MADMIAPSDKEIKTIVQAILQSKTFKDSPVSSNLLHYLVESTLSRKIPKEITVAIDVFGKDAGFNSNKDSTVRYHILILRNKLDNYYAREGKGDAVRVVIPKGHYEIKFMPKAAHTASLLKSVGSVLKRWEWAVIFILLLVIGYLVFHQSRFRRLSSSPLTPNFVDPKDPVWGSFFKNDLPVAIILGDDFVMDEYCPEIRRYRQIRDWLINSENDLSDFLIQNPRARLQKSEISALPYGGAENLIDILHVVYQFQNDVSLHLSSTVSIEEIRGHNIIYVGEFDNLRTLNKIISKTPLQYQYRPNERLFIVGEKGDTLQSFLRIQAPYEQKNKYNVDYSTLIKLPGFANENFMFIVGFGYGGRLERTKMLSRSDLRAQFVKNITKIDKTVPEYFIVVFEVKSIERTGLTNELKYFREIPKDFFKK
jgi:hypothetical protein